MGEPELLEHREIQFGELDLRVATSTPSSQPALALQLTRSLLALPAQVLVRLQQRLLRDRKLRVALRAAVDRRRLPVAVAEEMREVEWRTQVVRLVVVALTGVDDLPVAAQPEVVGVDRLAAAIPRAGGRGDPGDQEVQLQRSQVACLGLVDAEVARRPWLAGAVRGVGGGQVPGGADEPLNEVQDLIDGPAFIVRDLEVVGSSFQSLPDALSEVVG